MALKHRRSDVVHIASPSRECPQIPQRKHQKAHPCKRQIIAGNVIICTFAKILSYPLPLLIQVGNPRGRLDNKGNRSKDLVIEILETGRIGASSARTAQLRLGQHRRGYPCENTWTLADLRNPRLAGHRCRLRASPNRLLAGLPPECNELINKLCHHQTIV